MDFSGKLLFFCDNFVNSLHDGNNKRKLFLQISVKFIVTGSAGVKHPHCRRKRLQDVSMARPAPNRAGMVAASVLRMCRIYILYMPLIAKVCNRALTAVRRLLPSKGTVSSALRPVLEVTHLGVSPPAEAAASLTNKNAPWKFHGAFFASTEPIGLRS